MTTTADGFSLQLDQLPPMVRAIGDRARDAKSAADDARDLANRVSGLPGQARRASGLVADAQSLISRAQGELFNLQKDVATRLEEVARSEGYADLAKAIADAAKPPPKHHWWQTFTDPFEHAWHFVSHHVMDTIHTGLDIVGMVPVVGDIANGLNATIYLAQGDWKDAALSAAALIPLAGDAAIAMRLAGKGAQVAEDVGKGERIASDLTHAVSEGEDAARATGAGERTAATADRAASGSGESVGSGARGGGSEAGAGSGGGGAHGADGPSGGGDGGSVGGGGSGGGGDGGSGGGGGGRPPSNGGFNGGTGPVRPGDTGTYAHLNSRSVPYDDLTPHHMPQVALHSMGETRNEGAALVMTQAEHEQTRTYGSLGWKTSREDAGKPLPEVLKLDFENVRSIVGDRYDEGLSQIWEHYKTKYPDLFHGVPEP